MTRTTGWRWTRQRDRIITRDRACQWCRTTARLTVDHAVEVRHGGTDHPSNLRALCVDCHALKTQAVDRAAAQLVRRHHLEFEALLTHELRGVPGATSHGSATPW